MRKAFLLGTNRLTPGVFVLLISFYSFFLGVCLAAQPEQKPAPQTLAELQQRIAAEVSEPRFAASMWGVKIVSLDSGKIWFETNAQKLFSPASNSKLYTVALGLDRLGMDYRIKTSLYAQNKPDEHGVLKGDLIAYGRGDPTMNARLHGNDIYAAFGLLISSLTNAGIKQISGDLVGDDSFFRGPPLGSGWAWDDTEYYYGAEISPLTINDNTLQLGVSPGKKAGEACALRLIPETSYITLSNRTETAAAGSKRTISFYRPLNENVVYVTGKMPLGESEFKDDITVHNPAGLFVSWFREALDQAGIKVKGKTRTVSWLDRENAPFQPDKLVELGHAESLPMSDIAREIMKPSQNLYTDLILAHVGETRRQAGDEERSESLGIRELGRFLAEAGVKRGDVLFEEGSGLSRNNLTTPNATIALLQHMSRHKAAEAYLNAMPIAGVDGTLRNRMKGTPGANNVRAKTGTLRWANSLSGHVKTAAGERLIFSIMLNRYYDRARASSARSDIDAIAVLLASFGGKAG